MINYDYQILFGMVSQKQTSGQSPRPDPAPQNSGTNLDFCHWLHGQKKKMGSSVAKSIAQFILTNDHILVRIGKQNINLLF